MGIVSDGSGVYTIRPDGTRDYGTMTKLELNGETIYRFDPETGILEVSADEDSIARLTAKVGPLPATEIILPSPPPFLDGSPCRFHGVKEIKRLPLKNGTSYFSIK